MCNWNINPKVFPIMKCPKKSRWEVGFCFIIHNSYMFEGSGNNEYQELLCDKHFIGLNGCGNVVEFRRIGEKNWKDFTDYDNPFVLEKLVKNSYKLFIPENLKFKDITKFGV